MTPAALNDGQKLIAHVWFCTIHELHDIVGMSENPDVRVAAADTLLRYFTSMAQSINSPYIPESDPGNSNEDGDDGD
jgi:hypothetical protein